MSKQISFLGLGDVYLQPVAGGARRAIGSCSQVQLAVEEEEKTQQNYGRAGGVLNSVTRVTGVGINVTMQSLSPDNIALALRGSQSSTTGATVTAETHKAYPGALIRLDYVDPSSVTVKDSAGTTTYDPSAYRVTAAGIVPLAGGAIFQGAPDPTLGVDVQVDYTYSDFDVVEALTDAAGEYELVFDGLNEADSGAAAVLDAWRVKFSVADNLDLIGEDYAGLTLSGKLLADNSRGAGQSAFFRWSYAGAA